ncbi:hypothetical protein PN823_004461 [Enterobacter hormaechei]|nr:hypothetical protein [Enterobacter hormaechei]
MNLRALIDHFYGGNRRIFQEAIGVSERTVSRWLADHAIADNGGVYLQCKSLPRLPDMAGPTLRDEFEAAMRKRHPQIDLTRVGEAYIDQRVTFSWEGWKLAQEQAMEKVRTPVS